MKKLDYFKGRTDYGREVETEIRRKLEYDPLTGSLRWKRVEAVSHSDRTYNVKCAGNIAGSVFKGGPSVGYRQIKIKGHTILAHRACWFLHYGEWPSVPIDHIDRDRDNNAIANLKLSCGLSNQRNRGLSKNNTSGVAGVSWQKITGKWRATIGVKGRTIVLGTYNDFNEAVKVRKEAEAFYGFSQSYGHPNSTSNKHMKENQ